MSKPATADERILIIRLRSMGDCVLTTPALQLLSAARPHARIAVMVDASFRGIYEDLPFVHEILEPTAAAAFAYRPTLTLNLHGGTRSAILTVASLAAQRAGFGHYRWQAIYNIRIPRAQEILGEERVVHTAEHVASAMFYLGVPQTVIPRARLHSREPRPIAGSHPYAVLHPFASSTDKTWPAERFVEVARDLAAKGVEPVILGASADPVAPFADFQQFLQQPLSRVKALLRDASYFVGNDSGPAHIAAAFDLPMTVLFGPSNPVIWAPWRATRASVVTAPSMAEIGVEHVLATIEKNQCS